MRELYKAPLRVQNWDHALIEVRMVPHAEKFLCTVMHPMLALQKAPCVDDHAGNAASQMDEATFCIRHVTDL